MTRRMLAIAGAIALGSGVGWYWWHGRGSDTLRVTTANVTPGTVVEAVSATGTVAATRTVDVGTLVSGLVTNVAVDYNSIVHTGQVIAELDRSTYQTALASAEAAVDKAQIDLAGEQATLAVDQHTVERIAALVASGDDNQQDLDQARITVVEDQAQVLDDQSAVTTAKSGVEQAQINLDHCTITSPVDGVVIARNVDAGQTVQASVAAPTLYELATDLSTLDVIGNIEEADVTKVRPGDAVRFTVQAYPRVPFRGTVTEVRLTPTVTSDVVIYQVVIRAENADLRLLPGMTASVVVDTAETDDVLRVPNAALTFRPTAAMFNALHEALPTASRMNGDVAGADALEAAAGTPRVAGTAAAPAPAAVPPGTTTPARAAGVRTPAAPAPGAAAASAGTVVDRLFAPGPPVNQPAQVWVFERQQLRRIPIRIGVTDGTWTALQAGDLTSGEALVTSLLLPGVAAPPPRPANGR